MSVNHYVLFKILTHPSNSFPIVSLYHIYLWIELCQSKASPSNSFQDSQAARSITTHVTVTCSWLWGVATQTTKTHGSLMKFATEPWQFNHTHTSSKNSSKFLAPKYPYGYLCVPGWLHQLPEPRTRTEVKTARLLPLNIWEYSWCRHAGFQQTRKTFEATTMALSYPYSGFIYPCDI